MRKVLNNCNWIYLNYSSYSRRELQQLSHQIGEINSGSKRQGCQDLFHHATLLHLQGMIMVMIASD